jgi:putative Mg2+ transporter-C (MgtC) family protein
VIDGRLRSGGDLTMISPWELVLRLAVAAILGALVGLERERLEWAAGMRTHALVSLGSALFMVVSIFGFSDILNERHVILDPSRVAAQVASGIGFIGAGTIILRREVIKGLTTAASIWAVAAVGLAVGGGMFLAAVSATLLTLALLVLAKPLKGRIFPNRKQARRVRVVVERGPRWPGFGRRSRPRRCPWSASWCAPVPQPERTTRNWFWARAVGKRSSSP